MNANPSLQEPVFIMDYSGLTVSDYRPVPVMGKTAVFERTVFIDGVQEKPSPVLYSHDIRDPDAPAEMYIPGFPGPQSRPDWNPATGTVAFVHDGIWTFSGGGELEPSPIPNTNRFTYPAWYPCGNYLAVYNFSKNTKTCQQPFATKIDLSGNIIEENLGSADVYMGMDAVNQSNPDMIAAAAQSTSIGGANCYDQNDNYIWLCQSNQPTPLEPGAPENTFDPSYQGRAPWFSPDGKWVAFESNRRCPKAATGDGYAIFIRATDGSGETMQVTEAKWGAQHAKWVDGTTLIVTCYQEPAPQPCSSGGNRGIATLDVSEFVS